MFFFEWQTPLFDRGAGKLISEPSIIESPPFGSHDQFLVRPYMPPAWDARSIQSGQIQIQTKDSRLTVPTLGGYLLASEAFKVPIVCAFKISVSIPSLYSHLRISGSFVSDLHVLGALTELKHSAKQGKGGARTNRLGHTPKSKLSSLKLAPSACSHTSITVLNRCQEMLTIRIEYTEQRHTANIPSTLAPYTPSGPASLARSLITIFDVESSADVTFCFPCGQRLFAQKAILASTNGYFRSSQSVALTATTCSYVPQVFNTDSSFLESSTLATAAPSTSARTSGRIGRL
jgi:hypothetical protein